MVIMYIPPDPSFFPFGTTVMDAPTMMLNSTIPGTYIFPLNDIPPGMTIVHVSTVPYN